MFGDRPEELVRQSKFYYESNGNRNTEENLEMIKDLFEWSITGLDFCHNKRMSIFGEICYFSFRKLNYLNLWGNQITSVEQLTSIHMPMIQTLHLNENRISTIRVLRKGRWPSIRRLELDEGFTMSISNCFHDDQSLTQGNFPQLTTLGVYLSLHEKNRRSVNPSCIFKLETKRLMRVSNFFPTQPFAQTILLTRLP